MAMYAGWKFKTVRPTPMHSLRRGVWSRLGLVSPGATEEDYEWMSGWEAYERVGMHGKSMPLA